MESAALLRAFGAQCSMHHVAGYGDPVGIRYLVSRDPNELEYNNAMQSFNPRGSQFQDIYVVEKIETKEGWSNISPDEDWFTGYQSEIQDFYRCAVTHDTPQSNSLIAADTVLTVYTAYCSAAEGGKEIGIEHLD